MAKVHFCGHSGCHEIIPFDTRYCSKHIAQHEFKKDEIKMTEIEKSIQQKNYNQFQRNEEANSFYHSKQWLRIRDYVYSRDEATCQICRNVINNVKIVDHIIPLKYCNKDQRLSSDNLWTLCRSCHNRKTEMEEKIAKGVNGENKLKYIKKVWWQKTLREGLKKK